MDDTKKSVIRYEHMLITPDLLDYLGFEDILATRDYTAFNVMPERSIFVREGVIVAFNITDNRRLSILKSYFPFCVILHNEGLTLKGLIDEMLLIL